MPPSIPIAPPNLCQLGLSTCQRRLVGIGIQPQVQVFFFFLVRLLSFPRGRASSGDSPERLRLGQLLLLLSIYRVLRLLRLCMSTPPSTHATSWTTCPIPSATHEPSGRDSPYLLHLCAQGFVAANGHRVPDPADFCT